MQSAIPDVAMLQTVATGLEFINTNMSTANGNDKIKAAGIAARAASFAAQQEVNAEKIVQATDPAAAA